MVKETSLGRRFSMFQLVHEGSGSVFYGTTLSAGFDFCANEEVTIPPGEWRLIGTGMRIVEILNQDFPPTPRGMILVPEIQVRPRSGLAARHGVTVLNSPSTIDADYRGEIKVNLINFGKEPFSIKAGDRIAQGVCAWAVQVPGIPVQLKERGHGGFGSTGTS
jgi:dUTP pyrophosphatase